MVKKTIDINNMTGIQIKKANFFTNGYIQFIFMGSQESKRGVMAAATDEKYSYVYKKENKKMAEEIKEYIESILVNKK